MKHVSDGEKIATAIIDKKEKQISFLERENALLVKQIEAMQYYIKDLQESRKLLCRQIKDLVSKPY